MPRQSRRNKQTRLTTTIRTRSKTQELVLDEKPTQHARSPLSPKHIPTNINIAHGEMQLSPRSLHPHLQIGTKRNRSDSKLSIPRKSLSSHHRATSQLANASKSSIITSPPHKKAKTFSSPVKEIVRTPRIQLSHFRKLVQEASPSRSSNDPSPRIVAVPLPNTSLK
jgi:hypothetical protein